MNTSLQSSLLIAGIGMAGIFIFMAIFYLIIVWLDKLLPHEIPLEMEEIEEIGDEEV